MTEHIKANWGDWTNRLNETIAVGSLLPLHDGEKKRRNISATRLGNIYLINLFAPAQHVDHAPEKDSMTDDYWLVTVHDYGETAVKQGQLNVKLQSGDIAFRRASENSSVHSTTSIRQVILKIPYSVVQSARLRWPDQALLIRSKDGIAGATSAFILKLADEISFLPAQVRASTADTLLNLISACVTNQEIIHPAGNKPDTAENYFYQACAIIRSRLKDHDLSASMIANDLAISTRYLQRIFAKTGLSVSKFIWQQRLVYARHDLINPALANQSVTTICLKWGFSDSAHFSRAFKKKFSIRPSDIRGLQMSEKTSG
jgi:AraC-like DNA-binding protein